jgi:hypothetical protein
MLFLSFSTSVLLIRSAVKRISSIETNTTTIKREIERNSKKHGDRQRESEGEKVRERRIEVTKP